MSIVCPLWSIVVHCGPLWSIVVHCGPLWSIVMFSRTGLLPITIVFRLLSLFLADQIYLGKAAGFGPRDVTLNLFDFAK